MILISCTRGLGFGIRIKRVNEHMFLWYEFECTKAFTENSLLRTFLWIRWIDFLL